MPGWRSASPSDLDGASVPAPQLKTNDTSAANWLCESASPTALTAASALLPAAASLADRAHRGVARSRVPVADRPHAGRVAVRVVDAPLVGGDEHDAVLGG